MERARELRGRLGGGEYPERRASTRFPLALEIRYVVVNRSTTVIETGAGRTIDLSSTGLSFTTEGRLLAGQQLDVSVNWPVRLDGRVQLQLIVSGAVVRTSGNVIGIRIERYEFRTRSGTGSAS